MKKIRKQTFETNSSSTHSLVVSGFRDINDYTPFGDTLKIDFINTDEESRLVTLKEKVSYLVSHIISWYRYDAPSYEELIEQVKENYDFKHLATYVKETFGKTIVFPEKYDGDLEDIVNINHQLVSWNHSLDEVIDDMVTYNRDLLGEVLTEGNLIEFGRD